MTQGLLEKGVVIDVSSPDERPNQRPLLLRQHTALPTRKKGPGRTFLLRYPNCIPKGCRTSLYAWMVGPLHMQTIVLLYFYYYYGLLQHAVKNYSVSLKGHNTLKKKKKRCGVWQHTAFKLELYSEILNASLHIAPRALSLNPLLAAL